MTDKYTTTCHFVKNDAVRTINLNDFKPKKLIMNYPPILEFQDKEYKIADILDGLAAAAQYYRAGRNTPNAPQNDPNIPEREQMTVAQLRTLLKQGDNDARLLVSDLISELPNQITDWITEDSARYYVGEDLSDLQFNEFWYWMRNEWELVDLDSEIRSALEQWMDDHADELK